MRILWTGWLFMAVLSPVITPAGDAILVQSGNMNSTLIVTEELLAAEGPYAARPPPRRGDPPPSDTERAVAELKEHLGLLGEGELEVLSLPAKQAVARAAEPAGAGRAAIVLGGPELDGKLYKSVLESGEEPEAFVLRVADGIVTVLGPTPKAVLNGVYELLEQLGFRWYMPGEFGRVTPKGHTHALRTQLTVQSPSFSRRYALGQDDWSYRVRHGDIGRLRGGHRMPGAPGRRAFDEYQDMFALIEGERRPMQRCVSSSALQERLVEYWRKRFAENPDVRSMVIAPDDGVYGYCECNDCRALDTPGLKLGLQHPIPAMSDRYIWLNNQVIDRLIGEFPDIQVPLLIYAGIQDPPRRHKPDPRVKWFGTIANILSCRIHGLGNPNCPEASYTIWLIEQWAELGLDMRYAAYHWNLSCPELPFMMMSRMRDESPILHELGIRDIARIGRQAAWASHGPSSYLAAKMAWNVKTDVDALLSEFFEKFYGPASEPMRQYTMLLDRSLYESDYHSGSAWDLPHIYDEDVRAQARAALERAENLVGLRSGLLGRRPADADKTEDANRLYALRVEVASKGWQYFEAFATMMESRRRHDFDSAMAALERARGLADSLIEDYEYAMLPPSAGHGARGLLDLFFGNTTEAGYKCLSDGGELIAGLDPIWEFMLDPQGIGKRIGLQNPFYKGGNWQTIDTHHTWGTQGLRYYFGDAWYRQRVNVPSNAAGRKISLWFAGSDRSAQVWLNGQLLGNSSPEPDFYINAFGGIIRPFEFDATDAVLPGRENVVVVRVNRDFCNELGSGGLRDTAMFYEPGKADDDP